MESIGGITHNFINTYNIMHFRMVVSIDYVKHSDNLLLGNM